MLGLEFPILSHHFSRFSTFVTKEREQPWWSSLLPPWLEGIAMPLVPILWHSCMQKHLNIPDQHCDQKKSIRSIMSKATSSHPVVLSKFTLCCKLTSWTKFKSCSKSPPSHAFGHGFAYRHSRDLVESSLSFSSFVSWQWQAKESVGPSISTRAIINDKEGEQEWLGDPFCARRVWVLTMQSRGLGGHTGLIFTTWIQKEIKKDSFLKEMGYRFWNFLSHICEKAFKRFLFKPPLRTKKHFLWKKRGLDMLNLLPSIPTHYSRTV